MDSISALTTIVMVSYHTGPVLFDSIASVLAQTEPVQLCLVDNGNPPETLAQLQEMAKTEPRLKLITGQGNVGFGTACNLGAEAGQGAFLLFLNPDSKLLPDAVARLQAHAVTLKRPFMVGARLLDEDGTDQRGCRRALLTPKAALIEALHLHALFPRERLNFHNEPLPQAIAPMPAISGAFMFLPIEDFRRIGGFDEGFFLHVEDLDICLRFRRAGGEIYFAPDIVVTHIGGTSKVTKAFLEKHKARGFVRYFHENFRGEYSAPLLWLLDIAIWARCWLKIALAKV